MWGRVRKALRHLDPVRVENKCEAGTPDVNIVWGDWIELKIADIPKRGGIIHLDHYTPQQRTWAIRREHAGGRVWLLLKLGMTEWHLYKGGIAAQYLGKSTLEQLRKVAEKVWRGKLNDIELQQTLCSHQEKNYSSGDSVRT